MIVVDERSDKTEKLSSRFEIRFGYILLFRYCDYHFSPLLTAIRAAVGVASQARIPGVLNLSTSIMKLDTDVI